MKVDVNYPRMMFHRTEEPVTVYSEAEEKALGPHWSRKMFSASSEPEPEPEKYTEAAEPAEVEHKAPAQKKHGRPHAPKTHHKAERKAR